MTHLLHANALVSNEVGFLHQVLEYLWCHKRFKINEKGLSFNCQWLIGHNFSWLVLIIGWLPHPSKTDHDVGSSESVGYLPCFGLITDGKVADVKAAWQIDFAPGTIVVDDRGYNDYRLFAEWTESGVYFVTRMKDNALFDVVEEREPPQNRNIVKDQIIRLTGTGAQEKCPHLLRRVEAIREDTGETLVFLTNHLGLGASTIAAIYKDRWQIELFFKAIKQNLKIKTFVGTSANAVKTQIWTALIAMLLLRYLQMSSKFGWSLSNLVALLRMNLFTHRDLMTWLNQPFTTPPDPRDEPQASLAFA